MGAFLAAEASATLGSVSLVNNTAKTLASFTLPAGVYDIDLAVYFDPAASTSITRLQSSISLVDNTLDQTMGRWSDQGMPASVPGNSANLTQLTPTYRVTLTAPTTFYAVAEAAFTVSTLTAGCYMRANQIA